MSGAALLTVVVAAPFARDRYHERVAVREFEDGLMAIAVARQDQMFKGFNPLDKVRNPGRYDELQRWEFAQTHALVRRNLGTAAPVFGKYLHLLDGVYERTLRFGERVERLDRLHQGLTRLSLAQIADPATNTRAARDVAAARQISLGLHDELIAHHEFARRAVAGSGLDERARAAVWRVADDAFISQLTTVEAAERRVPELDRLKQLLRFLAEHPAGYEVDLHQTLRFTDPATELLFHQMLRRFKADADQHG